MPHDNVDATDMFKDDEVESRLLQISREYLVELESGRSPDRQLYLERYPELRAQLEECLEGVELACSLRRPNSTENAISSSQPLGDFRIVREIGRGGMGVVYEAIQLSLGRRVAVKVLPFAASLDDRHLQRFRVEAQAAAQLHHSNIVPVYAVGCERGTHFYAMQLINGQPISTVLAGDADTEFRTQEARPGDAQTLVSRVDTTIQTAKTYRDSVKHRDRFRHIAEMIAQVADALEYAHSCGIVHRDVKPANLLLDSTGKVWVTDFGLAHVAANNQVTQTGDLLGTLRYMSPEQASGQRGIVDHRTDIYSLGVTLYELLTHKPIFEGQDRQKLLNHILNDSPKAPRQIDRAIPVELETIVLKAIEHLPNERYATAGALAADLRRFLEERPILARRPTMVDQCRKWMRRHPSVVASSLLVLLVSVIALGVTTAAVTRQKLQAETRLELAQKAADEMIALAEDELLDNPFEEGLRQRLLNSALQYYQEFIKESSEDPAAQADLQITRDRVQKILADLALVKADRETSLLREPDVLLDLKLNDNQLTKINEFIAEHERNRFEWDHRGPPPPGSGRPDRERFSDDHMTFEQVLAAAKENDELLSKILTSAQRKRLSQIALQVQGPVAFRDMGVNSALSLTQVQKSMIAGTIQDFFRSQRRPPRGFDSNSRGNSGPPRTRGDRSFRDVPNDDQAAIAELMAELLEILTADQREVWDKMTGPVFKGDINIRAYSGMPHF